MKVPIFVNLTRKRSILEVWYNKSKDVIPLPFLPCFYSNKQRKDLDSSEGTTEKVNFVSDFKEHNVIKYSFPSINDISEYRDDDSMECDIPYIQRVCIDNPDFFYEYPNSFEPDILYLDIEVDTIGKFPKSDTNKIISIGYAFNDEKPRILMIKDKNEGDAGILQEFIDDFDELDPDIIATYFGNVFDIPYILDRLRLNGISSGPFTREYDRKECWFLNEEGERIVYIKGRVLFDIYDEVSRDQTLFGSPTRKMKDIAKWYKLDKTIQKQKGYEDYDIITEDLSNTRSMIGTNKLHDYMLSDVLITRELSKIYLPNIITMCDLTGIPFNIMVKRSASMIGTIIYARELKKLNVISDAPNFKRFPEIFGLPEEIMIKGRKRTKFVGGTKFQGAIVEINKKYQGKTLKPIVKCDYSSLYPNIIANFNISPETVTLIDTYEFKENTFEFTPYENHYDLIFSDNRMKKNIHIRVRKEQGFLPKLMHKFLSERSVVKDMIKLEKDKEKQIELNSKSWCYKVLANATGFGINGSGWFRYSSVVIAYTITAFGRFLVNHIKDKLDGKEIEVDSLLYNEPIIINDNNNIKLVKIGQFVDNIFGNNKNIRKYINQNIKVPCFNNRNEIKWKKIHYVYRHKNNKQKYRITLNNGRTVDITSAHSLFKGTYTSDKNGKWKKYHNPTKKFSYFNVKIEKTLTKNLRINDYILVPRKIPNINKNKINVYDIIKSIEPKSIREQYKTKKQEVKYTEFVYNNSYTTFSREIIIDSEFSKFMGLYLADGHIIKSGIAITLNTKTQKEGINLCINIAKRLNKKYYIHDRDTSIQIEIYHKCLGILFNYLFNSGAINKRVPRLMFSCSKDIILNFIDSWISGDYGTSTNKHLIYDINYLASLCDRRYSVYRLKRKGKLCATFKYANGDDRKVIATRDMYSCISNNLKGNDIGMLSCKDLMLVKIKTIEKIKYNKKYVYDIDVENNHNFIGGQGGICLHNTDGIYIHGSVNPVELTTDLNKYIKDKFNLDTNFNLDADYYKAGHFIKMKNYILLDENDKLIKHGVSLKASSKNIVFANSLDRIAKTLLQEPDKIDIIAKECYNIIDDPNTDVAGFIQQTKINRPLDEYSLQPSAGKKGCLQVQVGSQSQKYHEMPIRIGDSIAYLKTHYGYKIRERDITLKDLDKDYYRNQIIKLLEKFSLTETIWKVKNQTQKTLSAFSM